MILAIKRFCDVTCGVGLYPVSDFFAVLQFSFTRVTMASDDNVDTFYRIKIL